MDSAPPSSLFSDAVESIVALFVLWFTAETVVVVVVSCMGSGCCGGRGGRGGGLGHPRGRVGGEMC